MATRTFRIAFDLDGTLIADSQRIHDFMWQIGRFLTQELGPHGPSPLLLLQEQAKLDQQMPMSRIGRPDIRWAKTWTHAYEALCAELNLKPDQSVLDRVTGLAVSAYHGNHVMYAGAQECLTQLRSAGHDLSVITTGAAHIQQDKLRFTGLMAAFSSVVITDDKPGAIREFVEAEPEYAIAVGNRYDQDVAPAINAGGYGFLVVDLSFGRQVLPTHPRSRLIRELREIPRFVDALVEAHAP